MNGNNLAIIVAYYLSRYDKQALKSLGFKNDAEAFEEIARALEIKKNYLKFRRDEFDPVHPWRSGWQRKMDSRILRAIEALQDLDHSDLLGIVTNILSDSEYRRGIEVQRIVNLFSDDSKEKKIKRHFVVRGPTGRMAEDFFIQHHVKFGLPFEGKLNDTRDLGCGYDFEIASPNGKIFIEVKGLSSISGGILFTKKEWETAINFRSSYFLAVVTNLESNPAISFIEDPASILRAKKNIYTVVQVQWSVSEDDLQINLK